MAHLHVSKVKFRHPLPDRCFPRAAHQSGVNKHVTGKLDCGSTSDQVILLNKTLANADSSIHSGLGSPVWISTTVPSDWKWPPPIATDSSPDPDACLTKRQSTCELEGDSTVDDIVNQQSKVYSSLSQTRSDVKMVQSLVPIWQEEYERTGMHEDVVYSEHSKPLPENVLKTLSHGPECEMAFMNLCGEAQHLSTSQLTPSEDAERFLQSIASLADVGTLSEKGEVNLNCSSGSALSHPSSSKHDVDAVPSEISSEFVPVNEEMEALEKIDHSYPKGIDTEALGLLRWLASSQAEGELNTDDELGCDLILTPLFPKSAIDKILEKANLDYECESQQECQDILDSIGDTNSYNLKERVVKSTSDNPSTQIPSESIIPQVDGSFDDLVTGCANNASEVDLNNEMGRPSHQKSRGIDKGLTKKKKKKKHSRLWGSLPFSTRQKADEHSESSFKSIDVSNEMSNCTSSSSSGKKDSGSCDDSLCDADTNVCGEMEPKEPTASSMRDLMRRKRFRRGEPSEAATSIVEKVLLDEQHGTPISSRQLEFHVKENDMEDVIPNKISGNPCVTDQTVVTYERHPAVVKHVQGGCLKDPGFGLSCSDTPMYGKLPLMPRIDRSLQSSTSKNPHSNSLRQPDHSQSFGISSIPQTKAFIDVSLFSSGTEGLSKPLISTKQEATVGFGLSECCILDKAELAALRLTKLDETGQEGYTTDSCRPDMCSDTYGNTGPDTASDILETRKISLQQGIQTFPSCPLSTMHSTYVEMSFSKKPPAVDWRNCKLDDTSPALVVPNQSFILNEENLEGMLGCSTSSLHYERSDAVELPPFFSDKGEDKENIYKSDRNNNNIISSQEPVLGIPTHYKNDGSLLYLLTSMYSPPSVDCVNEWLLRHPRRQAAEGASVGSIHSKLLDPPPSNNSLEFSRQNIITDEETTSNHTVLTHGNDPMDSQVILVDVDRETLPESCSVPHVESMDELTQKSPRKLQSEGTLLKANEHVENLQSVSQISAPDVRLKLTPLSQTGFRDPASVGDGQQLTLMSIEVHAESRGDLRPDPRFDAINVIAITIQEDNVLSLETTVLLHDNAGEPSQRNLDGISGCKFIATSEEKQLFYHFMKIVRISDPDILMGWEIQGGSLGFLAERAAHLGVILLDNLSRTPLCETKVPDPNSASQEIGLSDDLLAEALITDPVVSEDAIINDEWGRTHASGVHVGGRIVLNVWRLMRGEIKLNMYTVEAVAEEVLRRRVPLIPPRILTQWFLSGPGQARYRCLEYIIARAKLNLEIMNQLDMINRTSELARVFGIDFFSVLSRGSQYRVESMLLRLAHTQNYLAISPGNQQVASQPAMECLPLVMEPESHFYADPVVVLDFQSLYPSMIIAYNLCFCTCLGKVLPAKENTLGVSSYLPDSQLLMDLKNKILLTPNGVMYVPSEVRKGVLPRLLDEILSTRIMVKRAMKKLTPSQQVLHRIFNSRQLALKLISNVTYGYTAAGFSGRMPCAELADSIVQCGRRTLESAISFVNSHERWKARVIYGDTDSMFVLLKGRSVEESFSIGQEIASAITSMNPYPVTLKMEKVYHPCFLLTKKRYVGFSYEAPDQTEPLFDAKGIETVRRDSCGAVAKTLEQSLKLFFEHQDISKVKLYLQRQWTRILSGRVSLQDFVFAKEVRLGTYSARSTSLPPSAIVATKAMKVDPRAEPRYAERIPYVVIHGEPGARLVDMVVDPLELLAIESPFRLNDSYYINKQIIPALQRVFGLVGADLRQWFLEMPRPVRPSVGKRFSYAPHGQRTRIDCYYISRHCFLCGELVQASNHLCEKCSKKEPAVAVAASGRTSKLERDIQHLEAICRHCGGGDWIVESGVKCVSLACSVFYERRKVQKELQAISAVATEMGFYPKCSVEWF